ncbi:MAG TPA: class I SAM-dependent methyltransferase [Haliangiales bacterium]|nr:class I SAM-dependent methyltransferase [Haliangiales bacterium]
MRPETAALLPLICLGCRRREGDFWDLHSLAWEGATLACARCGRRDPIVDGIPVLYADLADYVARDGWGLAERDMDLDAAALLALAGPDESPFARTAENLSTYLDAHWGDRAEPRPDGPAESAGLGPLVGKLRALAGERVARAIELGAGVGRGTVELAAGAEVCVGMDRSLSSLRRARRLAAGERVPYLRRVAGRHYAPATAVGVAAPVDWLCADALDPPLAPESFDRVAALNLLDAVHDPGRLMDVAVTLCSPGGEVIFASPYAWQSSHVGEAHRIGGADPAAAVRARLVAAGFTVEDEDELSWTLRRDARSAVVYRTHWLRARKA